MKEKKKNFFFGTIIDCTNEKLIEKLKISKNHKKTVKIENKNGILFFMISCFSMLLISCTFEEKFIKENNNSKDYQLFEKRFSEISQEKEFKKSLSKIVKPNFSGNSKTIMEQQYGFEIDEEAIVKEIHTNGIITYTIGIKNDSLHNNQLRNLLVEQAENEDVSAYILTYNLSEPLIATGHNSFQLNYSSAIIEPINYNTNQTSKVYLSNGCYVANVMMCNEAWSGNASGETHVATHMCTNTPYLSMQSVIYCPDNEAGGGGSSNPVGEEGGSGSSSPTSPTSPPLPEFEDNAIVRPCNKIKSQNTKFPSLKQSLINLASTTSQNYENGVFIDNTATATTANPVQTIPSNTTNGGTIPLNMNPTNSYVMLAHTHDSYGSAGNGTYSIFSWDDLTTINNLIQNNHIDNSSFVFYVITADGTRYALTVDSPSNLSSFFYDPSNLPIGTQIDTKKLLDMQKVFQKYYDKNKNGLITTTSNATNDKTNFLKFIKETNLGITLFEVDATFSTYQKLSISNSGVVTPTPCN